MSLADDLRLQGYTDAQIADIIRQRSFGIQTPTTPTTPPGGATQPQPSPNVPQTQPAEYSYTGGGTSLSDYAGGYVNFLASTPDYVVDALTPFINQQTGTISIDDINSVLKSVQDWTGSGRQGAGRFDLQDLLFDANGNPMMYNATPTMSEEGGFSGSTYSLSPSSALQDLYAGDTMPWATQSMQESLTPGQYKTWGDLSPEQQSALASQGIFNLDDSRAQFILTDQNDPQWNRYFNGINVQNGQVGVQDLQALLRGGLHRQFDALGNTSQAPSESWLFENPQVMLQLLATAIPGLGQMFGASNMQALTQAGNALNLGANVLNVGNAINNENWTQAVLSGFNVYNNSANLANAANFANTNPTAMGSPTYQNYTPGSLVADATGNVLPGWANNAIGDAVVAGFTGGDPLYYAGKSLVGDAGREMLKQLGIDQSNPLYGLSNAGLNYMYQSLYNNSNQNRNSGGGSTGGGGNQTPTTPTPQNIPPINIPKYTTQYYSIPSNPYGGYSNTTPDTGYGEVPTYGEDSAYSGESAQDWGNPYDFSKQEDVYTSSGSVYG